VGRVGLQLRGRTRLLALAVQADEGSEGARYVQTTAMEKYKRLVSSHSACWPALWPQPQSVGEACQHSPGVKTGASMRRRRRQATTAFLADARRKWAIPVLSAGIRRRLSPRPGMTALATVATRGSRRIAKRAERTRLGEHKLCNASLWNGAASGRVESQRWIHP